jgi:hypothetical protein
MTAATTARRNTAPQRIQRAEERSLGDRRVVRGHAPRIPL